MSYKILLTWNLKSGSEREHFRRIRDFVAQLANVSLELEDAWYTVYGQAPQILLVIVGQKNLKLRLRQVLSSPDWEKLVGEMSQYISDYRQRIVKITDDGNRFQI